MAAETITNDWYHSNEEVYAELHSFARALQLMRRISETPKLKHLAITEQVEDMERMLVEQMFVAIMRDDQEAFLSQYDLSYLKSHLYDVWREFENSIQQDVKSNK